MSTSTDAMNERRLQPQAVTVERRGVRHRVTWPWIALFALLAALFSALALWLLSRHYVNDQSLWHWSTVIGSLDAPQGGFNRFVLLYPQIQYYLLTLLSVIPGLKTPLMPYLISAVTAAALLSHFCFRLRHLGVPRPMVALVAAAIAANPVFLWSATNGGGEMMGIALYYVLGLAMLVLRYSHSLHAHMTLGLVLLLFFVTDARSLYLAATLLPLLPLVVQRHILRLNPVAPVLVIYSPLIFMILIWLAMNWIYTGDAMAFLKDPASPFLGARISADYLPWRASFGSEFWSATAISAMLLVLCYPVLLVAQLPPVRQSRVYAAALALGGMPVFAAGLATWAEFTQSPADLLVFGLGGVMALLTTGMLMRERPTLLISLLAAGALGSVALFARYPAVGMAGWFEALAGRIAEAPRQGDLTLGVWARDAHGMMLDENTGYAVIAARGHAQGLYLTFSDRFKQGIGRGQPTAEWIAVPSPGRDRERRDQVRRNFPRLYEDGLPGYRLVYDRSDWRVYASEEQWQRWWRARRDRGGAGP